MIKKVLIVNCSVFNQKKQIFAEYEVDYVSLYRDIPSFLKFLRIIHLRYKLPFKTMWEIKNIEKIVNGYDIIILHDSSSIFQLIRFAGLIEQHSNKDTQLVFYFWNPVRDFKLLQISKRWELLTFDYGDSKKYNIRYVGGFYNPVEINRKTGNYLKYDVLFIGLDKGRFQKLMIFKRKMLYSGLLPEFIFVSKIKSYFNSKYSKTLPYPKVIEYVLMSKAILDFVQEGQSGLTLRVFEAIFYDKKLITNNKLMQEYCFYNKNNILVLNEDVSRIKDFLSKPFEPYDNKTKEMYSLLAWLKRIDGKNSLKDVGN